MSAVDSNHPKPAVLDDFNLGFLCDDDADAVASHLAACTTCAAALSSTPPDRMFDLVQAALHESDTSTSENEAPLPLPRELRSQTKYEVLALVGAGAMGLVFQARHRLSGRLVALKIIHEELLGAECKARFLHEARALCQLDHPNIVRVYDVEQMGELVLIVMEYLEGENLASRVRQGPPLSVAEACSYVQQAARGLQHAHERGQVHRDVKPDNLRLSANGAVKLVDFGLVRIQLPEVGGHDVTAEEVVLGTPNYMAPEQAMAPSSACATADLYALGCTLFYLLTGRPPFQESRLLQVLMAHAHEQPPSVRQLRSDVPLAIDELTQRLLAKDPVARPQRAADIAIALEPFVKCQSPHGQPRNRQTLVAVTVTLCILVGVVFLLDTPGGNVPVEQSAPVLTVGGMHGQYQSLAEAVANAPPGIRISVQPGRYIEPTIALRHDIEIVGAADRTQVIIETETGATFLCVAEKIRFAGVTLLPCRGEAIEVKRGSVVLDDCIISRKPATTIDHKTRHANFISVVASPTQQVSLTMRDCEVRDNPLGCGIVAHGALLHLETCKIHKMYYQGIVASRRGKLVLRNCHVVDTGRNSVWVDNGAALTASDCTFERTPPGFCSVAVSGDARGTLLRCRVRKGLGGGVACTHGASLTLEDCDITENHGFAITSRNDAAYCAKLGYQHSSLVKVLHSRVTDNPGQDMLIDRNAVAEIRDTDFRRNRGRPLVNNNLGSIKNAHAHENKMFLCASAYLPFGSQERLPINCLTKISDFAVIHDAGPELVLQWIRGLPAGFVPLTLGCFADDKHPLLHCVAVKLDSPISCKTTLEPIDLDQQLCLTMREAGYDTLTLQYARTPNDIRCLRVWIENTKAIRRVETPRNDFPDLVDAMKTAGCKPVVLIPRALEDPNRIATISQWVADPQGSNWGAREELLPEELDVFAKEASQAGRFVALVHSYLNQKGETRFAAASWENPDNLDWHLDSSMSAAELEKQLKSRKSLGFRPVSISSYGTLDFPRYAVAWLRYFYPLDASAVPGPSR